MKNNNILVAGGILSAFFLVMFLWLQANNSIILQLPTQWLALALLPVLIALFAGGYISKFKGFGVELEANLKAPVTSVELTASDAVDDVPGDEKRSVGYLQNMSPSKKQSIKSLAFTNGKQGYYNPRAIEAYIKQLPNLQYLEIKNAQGELDCFVPASVVRSVDGDADAAIDREALERFVNSISQGTVKQDYAKDIVDLKVTSDDNLIDVLRRLRNENCEFAAVMSPTGKYLGVVLAKDVERKIADSVLAVSDA